MAHGTVTALDEYTGTAPAPYTAEESARDTLDMLDTILAEKPDRAGAVELLREHYAATAANPRLEDFTRRVARLILDGLPARSCGLRPAHLTPVR